MVTHCPPPLGVNFCLISRKGACCCHVGIAEVDAEMNSAARGRGGIVATLRNRNDAVGTTFEARACEAERRRAQGGLVLFKVPLGLCCTGGGGGGDDDEEPEDAVDECEDGWGHRGEMATRERKTKWSKFIVFLGASQHVRIEFCPVSSSGQYFVHIGSNI